MNTADKNMIKEIVETVRQDFELNTEDDLKELLAIIADEMRAQMDEEYRKADKQRQWETRYYNERDYGGRL